jgi:N-carbamoylputrescine amidase
LIGMTSPENPLVVIDLDIASVKEHQKGYPCYVTERI